MTRSWTTGILSVLLIVHPIALLKVPTVSHAQNPPLNELYTIEGNRHPHLSPELLKAIAQVESSECVQAVNLGDPSFGLMQVRCVPGPRGQCLNDRPQIEGWTDMTIKKLFNPEVNLKIAAQILEWNIANFGYHQGIAVYNSWSARKDPAEGPFRNQGYVDKVLQQLEGGQQNGSSEKRRRRDQQQQSQRKEDDGGEKATGEPNRGQQVNQAASRQSQLSSSSTTTRHQHQREHLTIQNALQWCRDKIEGKVNYKEFRKR